MATTSRLDSNFFSISSEQCQPVPEEKTADLKNVVEYKSDSINEKALKPWKTISKAVWLSLFMGYLAELVAGSNYAFAAWSDSLKTLRGYSQSQIELVGSLGNAGQYLGPVNGILFDLFGTRYSCLFAGCLNFSGYFLMYLTSRGITPFLNSPGAQGFCLMIGSLGSSSLYVSAVAANLRVFPEQYRGLVVGSLVGVYGLCATFLTGVYNNNFDGTDLAGFQLFVAITTLIVAMLAAVFLSPVDTSGLDVKDALLEEKETTTQLQISRFRWVWNVLIEKLRSSMFWLLLVVFFMGAGAGLMHINNFGQLTKALNGGVSGGQAVLICVTIQSVFNAFGRIATGFTDMLRVKRGWFLFAALLLMSVADLIGALIFKDGEENIVRVYGITVVIGTAYGMIWSTVPTITSEAWPTKNFAQNWGWLLLGPASASYCFNGTAGALYEREISIHRAHDLPIPTNEDGTKALHDCVGSDCFRNAYFFAAGMSFLGCLISLLIIPKTLHGKKDITDHNVAGKQNEPQRRRNSSLVEVLPHVN